MPDLSPIQRALDTASQGIHSLQLVLRSPQVDASLAAGQLTSPSTPFDLASLTKILAGVPVTAALLDHGLFALDTPVRDLLPHASTTGSVRALLNHSAGYAAWEPLYERKLDRASFLRAAVSSPLAYEPGAKKIYTDLGFLTLLALLEAASGQSMEALFEEHVRRPTGIQLGWGDPTAAPTEDCPVRGPVRGEVHDLNAWSIGGASTHAGLFGTASAVSDLVSLFSAALRGEPTPLAGEALRAMVAQPGPGSHRGGFDTVSPGASTTGQWFPADTLGHLGYTGTSAWFSPSRHTSVVLLTNRIHPVDDLTAIKRARPLIHDAVAHALGWSTP